MKKEDLIVGKWYKVTNYTNIYFKFRNYTDNGIITEVYRNGSRFFYNFPVSNSEFWFSARLATLEELREFLRKDYPDLNIERSYELW